MSHGGHLILIKLVLEPIPVYWNLLALIVKGILDRIKKLYFNLLWESSAEYLGSRLVNWKIILMPKHLEGWGLKYMKLFGKSLVSKFLCGVTYWWTNISSLVQFWIGFVKGKNPQLMFLTNGGN
jgi:hypothetical protein